MSKAITRPITPVRLGEKAERAPLKTGALVATEDPLSVAAVAVDEDETEDKDICTLSAPVVALVNDDNNEEENTRVRLLSWRWMS